MLHTLTNIDLAPQFRSVDTYANRSQEAYRSAYSSFSNDHSLHRKLEVMKHVDGLAGLGAGWDGYSSMPISEPTRANAKRLLELMIGTVSVPDITPNPNGTISLEWENSFGLAHLEVGKTRFSCYMQPHGAAPSYAEGLADWCDRSVAEMLASVLEPEQARAAPLTVISSAAPHGRLAAC